MLRASGFRVIEAVNGMRAVERFAEQRPAVTLMDLMMADGDGPMALRQIREIDHTAHIIALSGLSPDEAARAAPGANAFLAKPFSISDLLVAVKRELAAM